jgi:Haem degrading protein HbpS-like
LGGDASEPTAQRREIRFTTFATEEANLMSLIKMKKALTLAGADAIVRGAEAEATSRGARVVIAVVDDGGRPIVLRRLDHTRLRAPTSRSTRRARPPSFDGRVRAFFNDGSEAVTLDAIPLNAAVAASVSRVDASIMDATLTRNEPPLSGITRSSVLPVRA